MDPVDRFAISAVLFCCAVFALVRWWISSQREPKLNGSDDSLFTEIMNAVKAVKLDYEKRERQVSVLMGTDCQDCSVLSERKTIEKFRRYRDAISWKVTFDGRDIQVFLADRMGQNAVTIAAILEKFRWLDRKHRTKTAVSVQKYKVLFPD